MRRIDEVKSKKMRNVKTVEVVDQKRLKITFHNGDWVIIMADGESSLYFEKEVYQQIQE